jgi:hypothetical protein
LSQPIQKRMPALHKRRELAKNGRFPTRRRCRVGVNQKTLVFRAFFAPPTLVFAENAVKWGLL